MRINELKEEILKAPLPKNIAIILDGNGRWAKERGLPRIAGHAKGIERLVSISKCAQDLGINSLLVYAFSTENWNRPCAEVSFLMNALIDSLAKYKDNIIKRKMRIIIIGERTKLSNDILMAIEDIEESTKMFKDFTLGICFNYGGRAEIINATKSICTKVQNGKLKIEDIDETTFANELYTKEIGPIDLMIRTSGEKRLSNFLLWQLSYSEFIFTDVYWPAFSQKEFYNTIREYQSRSRRFGGLENKNE